jgi:hypothetical protein
MGKDATWVTLHRAGQRFDDKDEMVFTAAQRNQVEVDWKDDSHLLLFCHCRDEDVRFQVIRKGGINISYK